MARTDLTLAEVIALFKDLPPDFAPGERFVYSNSGYVLLGAVIEALSGTAYRTFLLERFFRPLGMRQTRYLYDEPIVAKRARGYAVGAKGRRERPHDVDDLAPRGGRVRLDRRRPPDLGPCASKRSGRVGERPMRR